MPGRSDPVRFMSASATPGAFDVSVRVAGSDLAATVMGEGPPVVLRAAPHFVWFQIPGRAERLLAEDPRAFVGFMLARYAIRHQAFPEAAVNLHLGTLDDPEAQRAAISYYRHAAPLHRVSCAAD